MIPKVAKSKIELIGPKKVMKRRMNAVSQGAGRWSCSSSTLSVGDCHLAGVVEQVVEQDLGREHRQEAEEQRGAGGAEHVREVRRGSHEDVFDRVGEDPSAFDESRLRGRRGPCRSRTMSAASCATSVAVWTEMPTPASCRATASLTPSPRKPTVAPTARWALISRDFCSGVTRAKIVVFDSAAASCVFVELIELGSGERPVHGEADVGADPLRHAVVVVGDDLDLHVKGLETLERLACDGLRTIDEGQEAREVKVALVVGGERRVALGGVRRDGDHAAAAGGELAVDHGLRCWDEVLHRASTISGAPLTITCRSPSCSTRTDARRRW
jgi:hypothetical protein